MSMWSVEYWQDVAERAVKTAAQTLAGSFGVGVGLFDVDWVAALSVTGAATVLSVLTSIGSHGRGTPTNASALDPARGGGRHRVNGGGGRG